MRSNNYEISDLKEQVELLRGEFDSLSKFVMRLTDRIVELERDMRDLLRRPVSIEEERDDR